MSYAAIGYKLASPRLGPSQPGREVGRHLAAEAAHRCVSWPQSTAERSLSSVAGQVRAGCPAVSSSLQRQTTMFPPPRPGVRIHKESERKARIFSPCFQAVSFPLPSTSRSRAFWPGQLLLLPAWEVGTRAGFCGGKVIWGLKD